MSSTLNKLRWSLERRGVAGTLRAVLQRGLAGQGEPEKVHPFNARYGTDTGGVIGGGSLGAGHAHDVHITAYAGMPPSRFEATMKRWLAEPPTDAVEACCFVDIGCGKGRVVFLASRMPFARVIGVELVPGLARTAQANLAQWESRVTRLRLSSSFKSFSASASYGTAAGSARDILADLARQLVVEVQPPACRSVRHHQHPGRLAAVAAFDVCSVREPSRPKPLSAYAPEPRTVATRFHSSSKFPISASANSWQGVWTFQLCRNRTFELCSETMGYT